MARELNADLVAYYPFNGNANDESGHNNHGIVRGATLTANRFGQPEKAYQFDGIDDYIEIADANSLDLTSQASISLWFYYEPQATGDFYTLLEKSDPERDGHSRYGMWIIRNQAEFCIEPAMNDFQRCLEAEIPLVTQKWHHLVGAYDGQSLHLYVNGVLAGQRDYPPTAISQNTFELFIGSDIYQSRTVYTKGIIDDIRIYKRVLTPKDVDALYNSR